MAINNDDIKWLYGKLKAKGYNVGTEQEFTSSLANEADRQWYYEKAKGMGLNMGSMADFNSMYAPQTAQPAPAPASAPRQQATPAAPAPASTPAPTAQAPFQSAPAPAPQQPQQPAWHPTEQDKIRMSYQIHTMLNDFNQKSKARIAQIQRMTESFTPEGRKKRAAKKFQAQLAGTKTTAGLGLNVPSGQIYDGGSPQPYGVEYVDGKPVTQWLMPDGSLTTSQFAADRAEDTARKNRLRHQFENRMKQNGLDPAKPEDVEMQAQYDAQAPAYDAVAELWQEAEEKHKADKERNADREWSNYAAMGGGREMRIVTTSMNRHADNISHMTRFDLQKMMDNAWARAGSKVTANCYNRLRQQYPDASEEELQTTASQMARQLTDNAVYRYAVQQNTPKSTLEYFGRTVADMNVINSISKGLARSQAGTSGDLAAYEAAMGEYGKNHRVAQIAGTVTGMAVDPVTWVSGGVGSLAGKGAINIGGRIVASRAATSMSTQVGSRLFSSSLTGRIITGAAAGGGNFATYEMLKEGESQFLHGGHINPETGENEGYSAGAVLSAGGHGLVLGSVTGTLSPVIGNVADKTVKATTSTGVKAGVRFGEVAVSTLAEGTIFALPEWYDNSKRSDSDPNKRDNFDIWTDNMAMMLGFKAQHGLKSAPRVIASLRPVKPVNGRPLTQAERNHNRMDFEERLRRNLDASPSDLSFTADEREELRRAGYGELADLFSRDRVQEATQPNPAEGAIELRAERVEAETISRNPEFDGYSSMEELMQDGNVSQSARAKAYYILTGRRLPMASVTGYTTTKDADGRVTVNSIAANGEVVTSRTFKNEQEAKQETDNIMRQAELNSVDVGERYKEAVADDMVLDAAISEVSPGADPATIKRIYREVKAGNKDVTESQKQLVEFLDDAMERNRDIADRYRPEAIREALKEETGIDVDAVLRKMPSKRTKAEQDAVKTYLERLFPEEARQQAAEPTAEQAEAQSQYEQGRELFGHFEEGDPTVQADVDAIALRMQEAYQAVEDAFGSEAEYYMFHVNENPWALVDDPELTVEQKDAVLYYINAKAALDGVMDASNEVADRKRAEVEESVAKRTHKDNGVIIPATMKVDDRPVYIVKGDVVMFPDGTAVDVHNSSESVVVMDAQTGEYQFTSPDQIFKVSEAVNPQDELDTALSVIEQEQMNIFGDNAVAPEESAEGEIDPFAQPAVAEAPATADTEAYDRGYESGLNDAKNFDDVKLNTEIENLRADSNRLTDFGRGLLEAYEYEQQNRAMEAQGVPEMPESVPNPTENPVSDAETAPETVPSVENGQQTALSRIPLNEKGEPRFEAVDKETAWDGLVEAVGGEDDAVEIALAQVQQATADLEALNKKPPTMKAPKLKGSPMAMAEAKRKAAEQYQNDLVQYNQQIAEAQARIDAWNGIVAVHNSRKAELRRQHEEERRQRDAEAHDAAVARFEEEQRIKAEKQAEQERIGVHAVNPKIRERWEAAPKIEGNADAITLPDGSTLTGRYVLTEAGAASPSHDANNAYAPTEGFPIDENGQSVNDRDYQRDKDAQRIVEDIAGSYDNRALQDPVIVSRDGVVLSGNNRTMSGDLAAGRGTDKAYVDYLAQFGHKKFGFTPEQVAGMKNPRVVFVPDEALPYDATTFARFNAQEKKSQGKPEAAVKLGKIVPDNVFNSIVNDISRYDRLSDYYADEKAVAQALGALMQAKVINDKQLPEMRTGTALSAAGKELIENTLIGKVFQASPDAVRQIISVPTLRQSIVMGLSEIANNRTLSRNGYDISDELSKAVDLVARAKTAMPDVYTDGMPVSPFGRMQGLFDDEFGDSRVTDATTLLLADILNSGRPSDLRKILTTYNNEASQASGGQMDMFSGSIPTKEEILTTVNEHFRNATPKEQQALVDAAIAERKRRAEADAEQRERSEASEQTPNDDERSAVPQQPTADGGTELEPLAKDRNDIHEDTPEEAALRARISVGDEWEEKGPAPDKPIYKRKLYVDGKYEVIQTDAPDKNGSYTGSQLTFDGRDFGDLKEIADYIDGGMQAEPTEAQKAAGNYKMEHRRVDGYNISIENAKGSVRRGTGADGKPWETTMQNDYGYIRGTEGVDGDHIDVFLSDTPEEGDVFVVDQVNEDGSFDEHKVMYGFPTEQAARDAYLSNYEPGWTGLGAITHVSKDEFKKWIQSSRRKTKPFAEYKSVKPIVGNDMIGRSLTEQEATELIARMEATAEVAPTIELTPENWIAQFGEDGTVETPIGIVKMGANQLLKLYSTKRTGYFGMIHPTLSTPDVILEEADPKEGSERDSKYLFVKTFVKSDGSRIVHFESVTVKKDGMEVSISSHEIKDKSLKNKMQNDIVLHLDEKLSPSSELRLTEAPSESEGPDLVPTSDNVISSDRKDNTLSADKQAESAESSEPYTITPTTYTNKKGKTSDVHLVKFNRELTAEEKAALDTFAREPLTEGKKTSRGWYDRKQGGYMMRSEEAARQLAEMIGNEEAVADAQPMTADELREAVAPAAPAEKKPARKPKKAPINRVSLEDVMTDLSTKGETKLSDHAEPVKAEPEQQHEISDDEMQSLADELRDLLGIGDDEGDTNIKFRDPGELTPQERQRIQSAGIRLAMGLIERGTTAFPDYATKMVGLLGDKIRPWLKSFYEGARWTPGYDKYTFTPTEQVATFDVQNFDKKQADPIAQAAMIVEERKASTASAQAQKELTETRNINRRENDKQTEADTTALAEKAEAVAGEAEVTAQSAGTGEAGRKRILRDLKRVDDTLDEVNDQLAILGYYEAEEVDKDFNEAYGYMRNAEKKAVKDAVELAKQLVNDLGLGLDKVTGSTTANRGKRKNAVTANIAPAGGDISIRLPLNEGRELYITIGLDPSVTPGDVTYSGDNLQATRIMYRVEWPDEKGHVSFDRMGRNCWADANVTYADLLNAIQREAKEYLPSSTLAEEPAKAEPKEEAYHGTVTLKDGREAVVIAANHVQNIGEPSRLTDYIVGVKGEPGTIKISPDEIAHAGTPTAEDKPSTPAKAEETHNGYKIGDEVLWDRYGNGKWEKQRIADFDKDGRPILDSFGQNWITEIADWERIKPADGIFGEAQRVARAEQEKKKKKATADAVATLTGNRSKKSRKKDVTLKPEQPIGDLFGGLFDNPQNSSNHEETEMGTRPGEAGGQRQQLKQDTQVGGDEPRRETERPAGEAGSGSTGMDSDADRAGSRGLHDVATQPALERLPEKERKNVHNNHVERGTEVAPKSESARIKANIAAIETMKKLEASGEAPTAADMKKLRAFSGWGGLGKAFSDWDTSRQLRQLLGDKLYDEGAEMSRNSAYFTPAYIVDAMWDIARAMGFKGGRVLEGSAGIGNVLGLMPQDLSERSYIRAVEKDPTTGKMLSLLYPDAVVDIDGFEKVKIETGTYDLVITNVPFVPGLKVADTSGDADISKEFKTSIHDFCIAKNVRKLRDGGIGVFITTAGSMDGTGRLYKWLANRENADIVGMFRMHNETFGGTNATSDIIVVRKRVNGVKSPLAIDCSLTTGVRTAEYNTGETKKVKNVGEVPIIKTLSMSFNRYYVEHPEYMAGEMHFGFEKGDTSFRPESKGLYPVKEKDQSQLLSQWVEDMKRNLADTSEETAPTVMNHRDEYVPTYDKVGNEVKTGTIVVDSQGRICVNYDGMARPLMSKLDNKSPKSADERIAQFNKNKVKGRTRAQVVQDYNAIKKALNDLLEYQKASDSDEGLQPKLKALNRTFDSFVATYGHLHGNNGLAWLKNDVDYPSVIALETYREEGLEHKKVFGKADIFSRRVVVRPEQPKATNVRDGVTLSIRQTGSLDTRYIAEQLGMNEADVRREVIEAGLGYENPLTHSMEAAHEYLSGNVREKMQQAEANNEDGRYTPNITALRKVVPHSIPSHFIEFSIGSSWLRPELFEQYVKERTGASVKLTYAGGMWAMDKPRWTGEQDKSFGIRSEICDKVITGTELIEAAMTNRTIRVSKQQKDGPTISDPKATSACAAKVDEIRDDFKSWLRSRMEADPELAKEIEERYNDIFNNSAPMTIPDEYIPEYFDGAARVIGGKPIKMRKHQAKAIVRGTMQSLMLAHEVGTGKTFTLITTAMEMRRLGTAKKPMIVVQNATLGQFVASAKALYPDARILSLEDRDRNAEGRKDFYAKIRYNDWDMVVIPQSVLERIPDHPDRERRFIEESIQEKMDVIEAMSKDREAGRAVAALKKDVENLRDQLNKLSDTETAEGEVMERVMVTPGSKPKKDGKRAAIAKENAKTRAEEMLNRATDDTLNFDDLGVDAILVDEAHEYKHLGFATAMQRGVKGVDPSYSKKCQGLYLKVKAVQEKSGGRNVIFATGTPISNTAAEVWTFMRYLLPREVMEGHNIWHFDDFVRNFGSIQQMLEFTTQGTYKENNRFAGYSNLPELARIWAGITDTVLTAEAGEVKSQIPELEGGQPTDLYLPQTNGLRAVLKFVRAQLKAYDEMSGQEKKENSHIPLVMYGIAKAAAIDARLVMANAPDDPHSKTNEAVRQTLRSLEDSKAYNGTVAIFADNYQRKNKETGAVEFNLFDDIRTKLIAQGVPAEQVVIMRDGMTDKAKEKIFAKVNAGEIRVILGTTQRLGVGVNIQERLHTLMHIDAPNRPMDYWQRMGRLLRQGNMHKEMGIPVRVIRFGVEDSLDVTAYQRLKTKGAIADAIMHSKDLLANNLENRILEEEGDEFGNITAELSGSQYAMLQNQTEKELRKLQAKQDQHRQHQMYIHRAEPRLRELIEKFGNDIARSDEILALLENNPTTIAINGKTYESRDDMQKVFEAHNKSMAAKKQSVQSNEPITSTLTFDIGNVHFTMTTHVSQMAGYGGQGTLAFDVQVQHDVVSHDIDYKRSYGDISLKRIINELVDNVTSGKEERSNREGWVNAKERNETDLAALLKDKGKPFEHGDRIKELEQKLEEYTIAMQEELKEKEAKYAEMDANIEDATDITFTSEDDEDEDSKGSKSESTGDGNKYRPVAEGELLDFLDAQPLKKGYRYSQWANMGVLPPMTAKQNGEWRAPMIFSRWEQSEEGMRKENGKADLVQGNGRTTGDVAYNPYFHIRTSPLNDQFTAAYDRPELLVVEGYYPESEETSSYQAEGAKDSVGLMDWHSGSVNGQLSDDTKVQTMLSRYFKPGRIVPWSEVADLIMERVGDQKITFPINAVPPMLRAELAKRGAKFGDISGSVAEADIPMLNELRDRVNAGEWDAGLEKARAYLDAYESSTEAKEARVADLSARANTPVRIVRTQEEADALHTRRERRAKGWWSAKDDEVVIVLPNNVNVADVDNTFVHEVAGHKGLRALIGEERFDEFLGEIYDHASNPIRKVIDKMTDRMVSEEADRLRVRKAQAHERAGEDVNANYFPDMAKARVEAEKKREEFRKEATEEYMSDLGGRIGSEGFEKMSRDELTLWGKIKAKVQAFLDKFLQGLKIAKSIRLNDKDLSYILYKSWKNLRKKGVFADAEDVVMRRRTGYDADEVTRFRDPGLGLEETITKMKAEAMQANAGNLQAKRDAMRAIGGNLNHLRQAMARQREYDITTAKSIKDLARILMENGLLDSLGNAEVKSLLAQVTNSIGRQDISKQVDRVFEIMVNNHLRNTEQAFGKLISMRTSRVDGRGIQVQGDLDPDGQAILRVFNNCKGLTVEEIDRRITDAIDSMSDLYAPIAERATLEYAGLQMAREYAENIASSKTAEKELREEIKKAKEEKDAGRMTADAYRQFEDATRATIQQMKLDRIAAYESLTEKLGGELRESVERAKQWRDAEKERVNAIHHYANSDMQGRELRGDREDTRLMKLRNHWSMSWLLEPMSTLDQMLKMFGSKNPNGEGYLYNHFMRGWADSADREQEMKELVHHQMDDKAAEIFGKHRVWYNGGVKKVEYTYSDIYGYAEALPGATITYYDGAEMREYEVGQGTLLYLYAVDKMPMGRATNRRMGIEESIMQVISDALDPKLKEYADWVQEELLPQMGDRANEVHKKMFGASMDAIENYFPFVRDKNALKRDVENGQTSQSNDRISVQTGAIKKRVPSVSKWNMRQCDFMDVLAKHVDEMCHWTAFAELNRDFGTLLSYNRLKQQVFAMTSVYGAGQQLWKRFEECCAIATDAYDPQRAKFDRFMVQGAKGVTMGKISLRTFTALKQTLSLPAFFGEVDMRYVAADLATGGVKACKWAWANMPNFRKRILSRTSGDYRLKENEYDGKIMKASSYGMLPNIGVDAWTIAVGSHGVYKTRKAKYLRWGMDESQAERRAIQDAELCYNKSQQSSEGPFMAPVQVDHTFYATSAMLFRNSSTSYTREAHTSARNLKRIISGEVNEDFVAKQILRTLHPEAEGAWTDDEWDYARKNAKREIRSATIKNTVNLAMFGWILPWLWRIGGVAPLLLLSGDDEEKDKQWNDATRQSMFAPIEGLAYGDVIEDGLNMLTGANEKSIYNLGRSNPILSDIMQAAKKADKDQMAAANDVINILVGMGTGINPQTITDWAAAIIDYNSDAQTQHECALLVARLLSCPQSQLEKVYFEELDMDALEASQLTPDQLAERYARYKVRRGAPLTGWAYGNEQREKIMDKYRKRSNTLAKERLVRETDKAVTDSLATWNEEYNATKERVSAVKKVKERDEDRYYDLLDELEATPEFERYQIISDYKRDVDALTKEWLRATTPEQRDSCTQAIINLKRMMVTDLRNTAQ
jgi:N12 class adenine-specific DNA methylase